MHLVMRQVDAIAEQDDDKMYAYMLNTIEENLLGTPKSYQIDKAWEGIHYCLCEGDWYKEEGIAPNIVFGGYLLLDHNDCVIFVNDLDNIQKIVDYLEENNLQEIIKKNFDKTLILEEQFIDEYQVLTVFSEESYNKHVVFLHGGAYVMRAVKAHKNIN